MEVILIKRFVSLLLVFALAVGLAFDLAPRGKAVAPVALVEAALASYVASTGYKLWVDNGTGSDVLSLMSDLYSDWLFSLSGGTFTLEQIGNQNLVYTDNSGHICITKTAADIFQDFSDWLQSEYSVPVGSDSPTQIIQPSGGNISTPDGSIIATSVVFSDPVTLSNEQYYLSQQLGTYSIIKHNVVQATYPLYFATPQSMSIYATCYNQSSIIDYVYTVASSSSSVLFLYDKDGVLTVIGGGTIPSSSTTFQSLGGFNNTNYAFSLPFSSVQPTGQALSGLTETSGGLSGLAVSLAQNVIDKATDLAQDYVLVFDVGASAGATATDIADAVVAGYDATTGVIPVIDTVTAADVIDTPVQPYPDVDSLGLPQLGLALTTRFPFSIPWDISAIYSAISAPSEPPVKTFDLIPASVLTRWGISANTSITIDLTEQKYAVLLAIIHWSCIIGFCFGLAVMTKRYVWTTGG